MISTSTCLMVTASWLMPSTQLASQGAGHSRAGELREVVGGVQPLDGVAPAVPVDQVVPLGDQIAQRTPVVAERNSAVHAPGRLVLQRVVGEVLVDLVPVPQTQRDRPALRGLAMGDLEEAARVSHWPPP